MNSKLLLMGGSLASAAMPTLATASTETQQPNILWISTEDCSPRWGCYGDPVAQTPTIDRLASEGIRYDNAFTTAAISAPVRTGVITGMYQTSIGGHNMRTKTYMRGESITPYLAVPPHYVKCFTEYLRNQGYYCTNNSKTDYQFSFDNEVPASIWNECGGSAHFSHRPDKEQPFFAVFNFNPTHEGDGYPKQRPKTDINSVDVPPYYMNEEGTRSIIALHYDNIASYDRYVAQRLMELEKDGSLDNTIIFLWGDHGDGFGRAKRWLYDSGTRIPLVIYIPGEKGGKEEQRMVSSVDFGPTVLSLAGVPIPTHMEGRAFLGDQASAPRRYVYAARDREDESYDMVRSVRDKRYLYIRNFYPNQPYISNVPSRNVSPIMKELYRAYAEGRLDTTQSLWFARTRPVEELYDVVKDPDNIHNLAGEKRYEKIVTKMRQLQKEWSAETHDLGLANEDELYRKYFPNGKQCTTNRPYYIVNCKEDIAVRHKCDDEITITSPAMLDFYCSTQGASMVYRITPEGEKPARSWDLYNGAESMQPGTYDVEVKAHRYGYAESETLRFKINVK